MINMVFALWRKHHITVFVFTFPVSYARAQVPFFSLPCPRPLSALQPALFLALWGAYGLFFWPLEGHSTFNTNAAKKLFAIDIFPETLTHLFWFDLTRLL
jgi:hypothetical protein